MYADLVAICPIVMAVCSFYVPRLDYRLEGRSSSGLVGNDDKARLTLLHQHALHLFSENKAPRMSKFAGLQLQFDCMLVG